MFAVGWRSIFGLAEANICQERTLQTSRCVIEWGEQCSLFPSDNFELSSVVFHYLDFEFLRGDIPTPRMTRAIAIYCNKLKCLP